MYSLIYKILLSTLSKASNGRRIAVKSLIVILSLGEMAEMKHY